MRNDSKQLKLIKLVNFMFGAVQKRANIVDLEHAEHKGFMSLV